MNLSTCDDPSDDPRDIVVLEGQATDDLDSTTKVGSLRSPSYGHWYVRSLVTIHPLIQIRGFLALICNDRVYFLPEIFDIVMSF